MNTRWIAILLAATALIATVMYVYIGSLAGNLAGLGSRGHARTSAEWTLYSLGLAATVAVSLYITRVARAALKDEKMDDRNARPAK